MGDFLTECLYIVLIKRTLHIFNHQTRLSDLGVTDHSNLDHHAVVRGTTVVVKAIELYERKGKENNDVRETKKGGQYPQVYRVWKKLTFTFLTFLSFRKNEADFFYLLFLADSAVAAIVVENYMYKESV